MTRSGQHTLDIEQAVAQAHGLQQLIERAQQSTARLDIIKPLLPPGLREQTAAGPLDDDSWCVLVPHHAAAAKLRQMLPQLTEALQQAGEPVGRIRVKIRKQGR